MVRIKRSVSSRKSRKKVLKSAKGYTGARSKRLRAAKEQVMHAGADAFTPVSYTHLTLPTKA